LFFGFCSSTNHFTGSKDQSGGLWFTNAHDYRSKTLSKRKRKKYSICGNIIIVGLLNFKETFGLYSAFLALRAISFRFSWQFKFTVDTMFLKDLD
jgi:hypothetical protein